MNPPRPEPDVCPLVMSAREVARELKVGERQARAWIASGAVYSFRVGRRVCISRASFLKAINGEVQTTDDASDTNRPALRLA